MSKPNLTTRVRNLEERMQNLVRELEKRIQDLQQQVNTLESRVPIVGVENEVSLVGSVHETTAKDFVNTVQRIVEGFDLPVHKVLDMISRSGDYNLEGAPHSITDHEFFNEFGSMDWLAQNHFRLTFALDVAQYYVSLLDRSSDGE